MNEKPTKNAERAAQEREDLAVRKSFRVPVENGSIQIVLNNQTFPVSEFSPEGVSIIFKGEKAFTTGQEFDTCELILPDDTITGLSARVIHFTNIDGDTWQNGIQWVAPKDEDIRKIAAAVSERKKQLLDNQ